MKNVLRLLFIVVLAMTAFALPALAQTTGGGTAATSAQDADAKAALYKKFLDNYKGKPEQQKVAYDAGKEYLSKYGSDASAENAPIVKFIQNWISKYEAATVEFNCTDAVNKNPAQAFQLCQPLLDQNPDNLKVYLLLVAAGVKNVQSGNKSLNSNATSAARKALDLIGQGKTADSYAPFTSQPEAVAGLHYYIGYFSLDNTPEETATHMLQAAQSNTTFAREPSTYQLLGAAIYNGEFKKLAAQYKTFEGQPETPESKALFDKINYVLDRVIDAYARAVALSNGKAQYAAINNAVKPALTTIYKQRHDNSDAGLNDLIASVLNKPLPAQEPPPSATPPSTTGTDGTGAKPAATPATTVPKPPVTKTTPATAVSHAATPSAH